MALRDDHSLIRSEEELDLPQTVEGVLNVLRKVLAKPFVQSIVLKVGQPIHVLWWKDMSDSLQLGEPEDSVELLLSRVDMEEFSTKSDARHGLIEAILYLSLKNLFSTHILVGSIDFLKEQMSVPKVVQLPRIEGTEYLNFLGLNLLEVMSLPEDSIILLASEVRTANRTEVTRALRITD